MEAINVFFVNNRALIYFIGGLSFFSMGLASALQRRHYSRLRMARWLGLLAGFGIFYGLNEWASLVIPLQEQLPVPASVTHLAVAQLVARGLALALLFQFGAELLRPPLQRRAVLRFLPAILAALWIGALVFLWLGTRAPTDVIFSTGDILARYLLGLPAAALACLGLLGQRREILEAGYTRIAGYLLGAAISLGFFGLVGVLLAVAGPFYPGEWLAYPAVLYTIGVFVPVLRALDGLVLAFFTGRALEVFEAETEARVVEMERRNLLLADRERISRELHDGTIQSLYAAGLRLEDACLTISEAPEDAQDKVRRVMDNLNQTIEEIRAYIFDLRKMQQQDGLIQRISELVQELRLNTMLETAFYVRGVRCAVPPERVTHLAQIVQECLSNTVRHAHAHLVAVNLHISPETLRVEIEDDGLGFDVEKAARQSNGMGLRTMGERVALLGGHLQVLSRPGAGTRIEVEVPCLCEPESVEENPSDGICTLANPDCG